MDESWRMRLGTPSLSRRLSTDSATALNRARQFAHGGSNRIADADDFSDVFGGPPRSVSGRIFPGEFPNSTSFYEEIFRQPYAAAPAKRSGRSLQSFHIPARSEEFYSDVFGSDHEDRIRRSRGKSSSSASALSSEELSPLRPAIGDDVALGSFASKLRPLNVPCRWNSTTMKPSAAEQQLKNKQPKNITQTSSSEIQFMDISHRSHFSSRRVTSPEPINPEPNSYRSFKLPTDHDLNLNSPSSAVSSLWQDWEAKPGFRVCPEDDDEEDEVMSSYVIEINSDHHREENEDAIGEAIAWAKEKFSQQSPRGIAERPNQQVNGLSSMQFPEQDLEVDEKSTKEAKQQSEDDRESRMLDEDAELWSSGKETT